MEQEKKQNLKKKKKKKGEGVGRRRGEGHIHNEKGEVASTALTHLRKKCTAVGEKEREVKKRNRSTERRVVEIAGHAGGPHD